MRKHREIVFPLPALIFKVPRHLKSCILFFLVISSAGCIGPDLAPTDPSERTVHLITAIANVGNATLEVFVNFTRPEGEQFSQQHWLHPDETHTHREDVAAPGNYRVNVSWRLRSVDLYGHRTTTYSASSELDFGSQVCRTGTTVYYNVTGWRVWRPSTFGITSHDAGVQSEANFSYCQV
jgi:hypothetical protein